MNLLCYYGDIFCYILMFYFLQLTDSVASCMICGSCISGSGDSSRCVMCSPLCVVVIKN